MKTPPPSLDSELCLVGLHPPVKGHRYVLREGENRLGRNEDNDICVPHPSVSRVHAVVVVSGTEVSVRDLDSVNGVMVGRTLIDGETPVRKGRRFTVGDISFVVEKPGEKAFRYPGLSRRTAWTALSLAVMGLLAVGALLVDRGIMPKQWAPAVSAWVRWSPGAAHQPKLLRSGAGQASPPRTESTARARTKEGALSSTFAGSPLAAGDGAVETATSPWSRRGPNGWPLDLPEVDPTVDISALSERRLLAAQNALVEGAFATAKAHAQSALRVDPLLSEAQIILQQVANWEVAEQAIEGAEAHLQNGRIPEAYRVLSTVPSHLPQAAVARARAEQLKTQAVADALQQARTYEQEEDTWVEAHSQYKLMVALQPQNEEALSGLRSLERRMRKQSISFQAWRNSGPDAIPRASEIQLKKVYGRQRARVLMEYMQGRIEQARSLTNTFRKRSRRQERKKWVELGLQLKDAEQRFDRIRREIANDPSVARTLLTGLEKLEQRMLPKGTYSYLVDELRADLSDAFAQAADRHMTTRQYEDAFVQWMSGYALDATNPRVVKGLRQLEAVAETRLQEAYIAEQRGRISLACDKFQRVERMTRPRSDIYRKAQRKVSHICR